MNFSAYLVLILAAFPSQSESQSGIFEDLVKFLDELLDWKDPEKVSKEGFRGRNIVQELKTRQTSDVCLFLLLHMFCYEGGHIGDKEQMKPYRRSQ